MSEQVTENNENKLLNEIAALKELLLKHIKSKDDKEWVSVSRAVQVLGIPREDILARIHNAKIPFHKNGTRYLINVKLARACLCNEDMENMKQTQKSINSQPLSRQKVTKNINNKERPKANPKVRKVVL